MARSSRPRSHDRWDPRLTAHALLRSSPRDRGTILLMVVGVLALLAIIGVVYATLGKSDRSSGATRVRSAKAAEQIEDVSGYFAGVIGDATFAIYPERNGRPIGGDNLWIPRVRGYDVPLTDQHLVSVPSDPAVFTRAGVTNDPRKPNRTYAVFNPTGSWDMGVEWDVTQEDFREYGSPFLASLEPEFLRTPAPTPNWERLIGTNFASLANRHDWRAISNFSPRGNFVNLANLRASHGGFSARPGFAVDNMSYGLTLYNPADGLPYPHASAKWPDINPDGTVGTVALIDACPLIPAHWTMNQVWAFRPALPDAFTSLTNAPITPSSYEYSPNQWADTDGDGFYDARLFEITDISELFGTTATARTMFSPRGRSRIFVAARCIDSSAMLNVNSSNDTFNGPSVFSNTDSKLPPRDLMVPPGISAGEVSLLRLLHQTDISSSLIAGGILGARVPYADLPNPVTITSPETAASQYSIPNARPYDRTAAAAVGDATYNAFLDARSRGSTEQSGHYPPAGAFHLSARNRLGSYATYLSPGHSLLDSLNTHRIQFPYDLADELELRTFFGVNNSDSLSRLEASAGGRVQTPTKYRDYSPLRDNRPRSLEMSGRDEFGPTAMFTGYDPVAVPNAQRSALVSVFADIRHLLTTVSGSRPVKDGGVAGETTADGTPIAEGASTDVSAALAAINNYSRFDRQPLKTDPPRFGPSGTLPWDQPSSDDYVSYHQAVQLIFRLYLNALAPYTAQSTNPADSLFPDAWPLTTLTEEAFPDTPLGVYRTGLVYGGNAELAFRMAAHMTANLIDALDRDRKLNMDPSRPNPGRAFVDTTTNNDNAGRDRTQPTPLSLQLTARPVLTNTTTANITTAYLDEAASAAFATPPTQPMSRLAPTVANLSTAHAFSTGPYAPSGMMNVFGVEPQPFITEVAWFGIYSGDPSQAGVPGSDNGTGRALPPTTPNRIEIKTDPKLSNTDFIGEIIAVQLNNPFDQDVVLYDPRQGPTGDTWATGSAAGGSYRMDRFRFYFEFAGRYYGFARQKIDQLAFADDLQAKNDPVVLRAGETRVFYFTNPGSLKAIADRANLRNGGNSFTPESIEKWLCGTWTTGGKPEVNAGGGLGNGQLFIRNSFNVSVNTTFPIALEGDPAKPQPISQVYPTNFDAVTAWPGQTPDYMDLWGTEPTRGSGDTKLDPVALSSTAVDHAPARRVAHLWRTRRSESSTQLTPLHPGGDALTTTNSAPDINDVSNDILADRLRDPTLDTNLDSKGALYEPRAALEGATNVLVTPPDSIAPDKGLTFVAHSYIRRPTDTDYNPTTAPTGTYPIAKGTAHINTTASPQQRLGTLRGVLPPWCLEVRADDDYEWGTTRNISGQFSMNRAEWTYKAAIIPPPPNPIPIPNTPPVGELRDYAEFTRVIDAVDPADTAPYVQPPRSMFKSLTALFDYHGAMNTEIARPCEQKYTNPIHVNRDFRDYKDVAVEYFNVGEDRLGGANGETDTIRTYIENTPVDRTVPIRRSRNPALFSRSGDFLLPLAVGPWFNPSLSGQAQGADISNWTTADPTILDREVQWMTLSEALALSAGYYAPHKRTDPYWRFGQLKPVDGRFPKTDRGHLALDRFSPYMQAPGMARQPLGSGVPFALSIIDQFRAAPGIASTPIGLDVANAPPVPEFQARYLTSQTAFGGGLAAATGAVSTISDSISSLTLMPGKINVNTMPESVAGTLSMLWPNQREDNWMYTGAAAPFIIDPAANNYPDLVKTLIDYRNNSLRTGPVGSPTGPRNYAKRSDPLATNIDTIRTSAGIKSLGEIAAINLHRPIPGPTGNPIANLYEEYPGYSMFHFAVPETTPTALTGPDPNIPAMPIAAPRLSFNPGVSTGGFYDRRPDGRIQDGIAAAWQPSTSTQLGRRTFDNSNNPIATPPTGTGPVIPLQSTGSSQVERSYQDKLAIVNAVTGSVSVRSDIFTVYFVVQAYTPESVDIPDDQPLVPSMAKRFVMVVDRSNVKSPGEKPKVLMLKEVPMN